MIDFQNILNLYDVLCKKPSDINEHLPTLKRYGETVDHITEFGVRTGRSTAAFLSANPVKMYSYDITSRKFNYQMYKSLIDKNTDFVFKECDVLKIKIEETDLLFIDTLHTYTQLNQELLLHGNKSRKYIIFHDTETFGEVGIDNKEPGLLKAIYEFIDKNPQWIIEETFTNNNGLSILRRTLL